MPEKLSGNNLEFKEQTTLTPSLALPESFKGTFHSICRLFEGRGHFETPEGIEKIVQSLFLMICAVIRDEEMETRNAF